MMSITNLLEDFGMQANASVDSNWQTADDGELLDTFEQGYKAGWEDAIRAKSDEATNISTILGQNLQELSFTYHEARTSLLAELAPVLQTIAQTVLPKVAYATLGQRLIEQLEELVDTYGEQEVLISVCPSEHEAVQKFLPSTLTFPATVKSNTNLTEGQAQISFGAREKQIDLDEMLEGLSQAFEAFSYQTKKDASVG